MKLGHTLDPLASVGSAADASIAIGAQGAAHVQPVINDARIAKGALNGYEHCSSSESVHTGAQVDLCNASEEFICLLGTNGEARTCIVLDFEHAAAEASIAIGAQGVAHVQPAINHAGIAKGALSESVHTGAQVDLCNASEEFICVLGTGGEAGTCIVLDFEHAVAEASIAIGAQGVARVHPVIHVAGIVTGALSSSGHCSSIVSAHTGAHVDLCDAAEEFMYVRGTDGESGAATGAAHNSGAQGD